MDGPSIPRTGNRAVLLQVGFTRDRVSADLRELLPHDFTLTPGTAYVGGPTKWGRAGAESAGVLLNHFGVPNVPCTLGRFVSVALSFELPRQDVILHLAR
jgi:hypothetical protein